MTFSSDEVRDAFHKLSTGTQVMIHGIWTAVAKQGHFLHIEGAENSDIIIRISIKPHTLMPSDSISNADD